MENQDYQVIDSEYLVAHDEQTEQRNFLKKTYGHVAAAFGVFLLLEAMFLSTPAIVNFALKMTQGMTWLIVLGVFMFATSYAERIVAKTEDKRKQYLGFFIYILAEALIFVPLLYIGIQIAGIQIIMQAFYLTLALFIGLSMVVFVSKKDFSFLRNFVLIGGLIAMGTIVVGMIFGFNLGLWFSVGMVILAAGSILYQTSNLIYRYNKEQYVLASLGLFASFMLLLWYIIQIFLSRD